MEVPLNLEQATFHVEKTKPLKLKEVNFKIKPSLKEQKRLFRTSLYKLTIIAEVNNQVYEFVDYNLSHQLISQLEKDPTRFLVGAEPPFLCGTNWPASGIAEVVEANNIPLDSLIIIDGNNAVATIYNNEIPILTNWLKNFIK
ncbi:hypothetical protein QMA09_07065 [Planococcus sp. APC 3906]|uniref:hypothetical protein n=1 Tax=Planococcus sp. APC 3906 TaxID=3035194 RepID=UPI0025B2C8DA|nr:hypothetical protein [Planococcus sp. APC 3906]MDN3449945.1 hypothetical protein [Planococcus sp. APC 3906]